MRDTMPVTHVEKTDQVKVYQPGSQHVVGDGFHVRNLFPSNDLDQALSPFIMLDYAGPTFYPSTDTPRGVGEHPHQLKTCFSASAEEEDTTCRQKLAADAGRLPRPAVSPRIQG